MDSRKGTENRNLNRTECLNNPIKKLHDIKNSNNKYLYKVYYLNGERRSQMNDGGMVLRSWENDRAT